MQLSRRVQRLIGGLNGPDASNGSPTIDQFMPSNERDQKIWFLELLDSQLNAADKMVSRLFDFVKRLQVDVQGSLTSAAQIKATSLDLASNTRDAAQEVHLLKDVARLIRSDMEGQLG